MLNQNSYCLSVNIKYKYKVSVIVPCYNIKPWLDECLQSLVDQTLQEIEIICINDGSTDGTGVRLDEWQIQYHDKIKVVHQINGGSANARNTGLAIAQGQYIGFVDPDDIVTITMYAQLYNEAINNNAEIITSKNITFVNEKPKIKQSNTSIVKQEDPIIMFYKGSVLLCTSLYKHDFLKQNKIKFIDHIYYGDDSVFVYDAVIKASTLFILPVITYYYRIHRYGQITGRKGKYFYKLFDMLYYIKNQKINNHNKKKYIEVKNLKNEICATVDILVKIDIKYKINFLFKTSKLVFTNRKVAFIYKSLILTRYSMITSYPKVIISLIILHSCYLLQKVPFIKLKDYNT